MIFSRKPDVPSAPISPIFIICIRCVWHLSPSLAILKSIRNKGAEGNVIHCLESEKSHHSPHRGFTRSRLRNGRRVLEKRLERSWHGTGGIGPNEVARPCGRV